MRFTAEESRTDALDFTYFRDLVEIAENHWLPIASAFLGPDGLGLQ